MCVFAAVCAGQFVFACLPVSLRRQGACRRVSHGCPKDDPQSGATAERAGKMNVFRTEEDIITATCAARD